MTTTSAQVPGLNDRWIILALLLPGMLALGVTFVAPLVWLISTSFEPSELQAGTPASFTLGSYKDVLADPFYWRVALDTVLLGLWVAVFSVLTAYPIAMFLAKTKSAWRGLLTVLAIAPLLTSAIVRTYGWMVILSDKGMVNSLLMALDLIDRPLALSNNFFGAVVALIEINMPYAILAMLGGFGRMNPSLDEAAATLGANKWQVFRNVTLPLSLPGVVTALMLVFMLSISAFVTPRLMGGGRVFVLATEVYEEATVTLNWPLAAALSILLLTLFSGIVVLYQRVLRSLAF